MDSKERIYDQFFGENTKTYVEPKNRTAGTKYQAYGEGIISIYLGNILMDTSTDEYFNGNQQSLYNPTSKNFLIFFVKIKMCV